MTFLHSSLYIHKAGTLLLLVLVSSMLAACSSTSETTQKNEPTKEFARKFNNALEATARNAEDTGNTPELIASLAQLYARNPSDPRLALRYAKALRDDEQLELAGQVLEPFANAKEQQYPEAMTELALISVAQGDYNYGKMIARNAITVTPNNGRAYMALGTAQDALGNHQAAEESFRKGLSYWNGDPAPILNNLALNLASQGYLKESVSILQKAKQISPRRMEIERNLRIIRTLLESSPHKNITRAPKPPRKPENQTAIVLEPPHNQEPAAGDNKETAESGSSQPNEEI